MIKPYIVTATLKHPACTDRPMEFRILAETSASAIKKARDTVARECLHSRHDGPLIYKARKD